MYRTACTLSFSLNPHQVHRRRRRRAHEKPSWNLKIEGSTTNNQEGGGGAAAAFTVHARLPVRNKHKN